VRRLDEVLGGPILSKLVGALLDLQLGVVEVHVAPALPTQAQLSPRERGGCGLSAKVVQEKLGHRRIAMTFDTYGPPLQRGRQDGAGGVDGHDRQR
jgi:hypothetical protein